MAGPGRVVRQLHKKNASFLLRGTDDQEDAARRRPRRLTFQGGGPSNAPEDMGEVASDMRFEDIILQAITKDYEYVRQTSSRVSDVRLKKKARKWRETYTPTTR